MKMENFTLVKNPFFGKSIKGSILSALLILCIPWLSTAQQSCPLGCNNNVQVSLDTDCSVEVTPDMVLEGQGTNGCDYVVSVLGSNNQPIPGSPFVNGDYIGQTLTVRVSLGANSCWGTISIEDKLPPIIDCPDDVTISCYESSSFPNPVANDNCSGTINTEILSDQILDLDCTNQDSLSAVRTIIYQAVDESGNESGFCTRRIFFQRIGLDDIVFPLNRDGVEAPSLECDNTPVWDLNGNYYPEPEETGTPTTIDGFNIFPNNSYCELNATFTDQVLPICESSFKVLRQWTVLDWCTGQIREEFQIIKVEDNAKPILTCPPNQPLVSADPYECSGDWDVAPPTVIFDCSSTTFTVAYLLADDNGEAPVNGIYIQDNVRTNNDGSFTIIDLPLGRTWIRYTVTDACGNFEYCFTEVDVIDDVPPVPVCDEFTVATLTTNGTAHIFAESFDDGSHDNCTDVEFEVRRMTSGCGVNTNIWKPYAEFCCADVGREIMVSLRVTDEAGNSNTCMVNVNVQDKLDPVIDCPDDLTVDCGTDINDYSITGEATASDNCGNVNITINETGGLNDCGVGQINRRFTATDAGGRSVSCTQRIRVVDFSPFNGSSIQWPSDRTLAGCMNADTDPSSTGMPVYNDDDCSLIADTYEDQIFTLVDDACFKILRTWTVLDWCQFDQNNPSAGGIWQYTQVIKVNNEVAPTFASCANRTVEAFGANCDEFVNLIVEATDDCTPTEDIVYDYTIDFFSDGSINAFGNTNDLSRTFEVGLHEITVIAEDMCGNERTCTFDLNVVDRKKPTPYCLSEITTVIMPSTGEIDIWASDFDLGSLDNCPGTLSISFSSNVNDTRRDFTCDDLGLNELEIWVTDAAGNQDFCTTMVNIQANDGCDGSRISGQISTVGNEMVEDVEVELQNMATYESSMFMTTNTGGYQFMNMLANTDYKLTASKDIDHTNGVSTLDLVLIQRHILGLQQLDSPYKVIAADINNNGSIAASDLLGLRKLILGIWSEFPSNESWRFVNAGQEFPELDNPFPFDEYIMVYDFNESALDNDFVAVKIGDVNNSASVSNTNEEEIASSRSGQSLSLVVNDQAFEYGDVITVPVYSGNFNDVVGFQFSMNTKNLVFEGVESGAIAMTEDYVGAFNDYLTLSWNDVAGQNIDNNEILFTLKFRAEANGTLNNTLALDGGITKAESYTNDLKVNGMDLNVRSVKIDAFEMELFQNTPNPFDGNTTITFKLPESGQALLTIYDVTGRVVYQHNSNYTSGTHELTVLESELNTKGVLYYQLSFNGKTMTKKMISM